MSFWKNEKEYKVKLVDFIERFVAHNTCVKLFTEERVVNEQGGGTNFFIVLFGAGRTGKLGILIVIISKITKKYCLALIANIM